MHLFKIVEILKYLRDKLQNIAILNLIVDIGNNSTKFYLFQGAQMILHTRRNNGDYTIVEEWKATYSIAKAIISSVIDLNERMKKSFEELGCPLVWFNSGTPTPLEIRYRTPGTLGSDRLAAAVGSWHEAKGHNILVIDAGSAITADFVDSKGNYHGGNIAPGIKMRLRALHEYTGRLPMVDKDGETPAVGYDTETAIRSGVITGICHEIEGYISYFNERYGDLFVFLTGGDEISLKNRIKSRIFADKYLVAKGLNRILQDYEIE